MAELSLSLPVKGEEAPGADAKVNAAFSEIQTQFNGKITDVNIETNRALVKTNNVYGAQVERLHNGEYEVSATRTGLVVVETLALELTGLSVGGVAIMGPLASGRPVTFLVPPGLKWKPESGDGTKKVKSSYLLL